MTRFARLAGVPERTYRRWLARARRELPVKGPWPRPVCDRVEPVVVKYAEAWPAWGHRKIAALLRAEGHEVSTLTVARILRARGLMLPPSFRVDRKTWAIRRKQVFRNPPTQRDRVWQTDFSEFETTRGGIYRICAVIDYATKYCLAITVVPTASGQDALACLRLAVGEAERVLGLDDLRTDRGRMLVRGPEGDVIGEQPAPIAVISDNGPCFRGHSYQVAFDGPDPLLRHVRTRVRSPRTNGVVERFFGTLKYEFLYRAHIGDADALAVEVDRFRVLYNTIRPHQSLGDQTPRRGYLA